MEVVCVNVKPAEALAKVILFDSADQLDFKPHGGRKSADDDNEDKVGNEDPGK